MADEADDKDKDGAPDKGAGGKDKGGAGADDKGAGGKDKGGAGGEKTFTQAEHDAEVEAAVAADRQARRRAAAAKPAKSVKGKKDADGDSDGDSEELAKERQARAQVEEKLRVREAQDSVVGAAKTAGFANPEKIYRLVKDDLSFDDAGKPENIKDLIALAKRDFPEELGAKGKGSANGGEGNDKGAGVGANMNDFIRRAAGRR